MKKGIAIVCAMVLAQICLADGLQQKYEKAYYLETAKGQTSKAAAIYKSIIDEEVTDQNRETIRKSLLQLLGIATLREHEPTIQECQEKLLRETDTSLQQLIDIAQPDTTIHLPSGTYTNTVVINKNLTLKGADCDTTILSVTADKPLIQAEPKQQIALASLTLKSQLGTSQRTDPPGCTLLSSDATVTVSNCAFVALGNSKRSPVSVLVRGFSEVQLVDCRFQGFEYPIFFSEGSKGLVKGCIVQNPGHCGFMSHSDSEVVVEDSIFTGSAFHGVRSTGGTIHLKNNLIINNRNRGIYLGNKSTHGEISNNAIIGNGTGISAFASSDVEIEHNVILNNEHTGIDTRGSCRIAVKDNIIAQNGKFGFAVYEGDHTRFSMKKNTIWGNESPSLDYDLQGSTIEEDPEFTDAENGDFSVGNKAVQSAEQGLSDPDLISALWATFKEAVQ